MNRQDSSNNTERIISLVLQVGVAISSVIILVGILIFFTHDNPNQSSYHQLTRAAYPFPHSLSALKASIQAGEGVGFIELGTLLLILTPILRVAVSILLFKKQKDTPMTLVTLFVLLVLVSSFILGITVKGP